MDKYKYSKEEDKIIIKAVRLNPQNLDKVFRELSKTMNRSYASIRQRYYRALARNKHNKMFFTLSYRKKHTNYKVFKKGMKVGPEKNTKSKWQRILAILAE